MLKRFLMLWLIISTLGYGSVWAFDGHIDEINQHQDVVSDVDHSRGDDGDHPSCDHCCHASAHTVAMSPFQTSTTYPGADIGSTPYRHSLSFLSVAPPDRPPRI